MAAFDGKFGDDFGQKVDLTANIRGILRNYPEGTAILKELVQNADDAGARKVSVCLDCRHHATSKLADPALGAFQGPALLAYNDSVFTDEDFRSIQRIGDSLKKASEDQTKIGRFGIGFNAVYHWTDLPSFVSQKQLVMLDPQARFLPNVNPSNPGKMVDWHSNPEIVQVSLFVRFRGLYLFTGGWCIISFHVECFIIQLWCSSIILCNTTSSSGVLLSYSLTSLV